jgi:nitrous oxidase accessory protein
MHHVRSIVRLAIALVLVVSREAVAEGDLTPWVTTKQKFGALQIAVSQLSEGETLFLPAGVSEGPIIIRTRGVTIDGRGLASIDGKRLGTVISVEADGVTLKNFTVTGSGTFHDRVDAGVSVNATHGTKILALTIVDCLFGIDVKASTNALIENNVITSKNLEIGLRGDAIRLWASKDVVVRHNKWRDSRDVVSWYSERIEFSGNEGVSSRYSLHSMYSNVLMVKNNRFSSNSVGIFIMYGEGTTITNNTIEHSIGAGGIGIGTKETSSLYARNNRILYSTVGLLIDNSPWQPNTKNWFYQNTIGFSGTGVVLSSSKEGNEFRENHFIGNTIDADSEIRKPSSSVWVGNYWDQYDGFDRDKDGVGDTPYRVRKYGDVLVGEHPTAQFFVGSPVLSLIDLVQKLVPLSKPTEILTDSLPRIIRKPAKGPST